MLKPFAGRSSWLLRVIPPVLLAAAGCAFPLAAQPMSYAQWHRQLDAALSTNPAPAAARVYSNFFAKYAKEDDRLPFGSDKTAHEEFLREYVRWGFNMTKDSALRPNVFEKQLAPNTTWAARRYIANYLMSWYEFAREPEGIFELIFHFYQVEMWDKMNQDRRRQFYAELLEELRSAKCNLNRPPRGTYAVVWNEVVSDYKAMKGSDADLYLQLADTCRLPTP